MSLLAFAGNAFEPLSLCCDLSEGLRVSAQPGGSQVETTPLCPSAPAALSPSQQGVWDPGLSLRVSPPVFLCCLDSSPAPPSPPGYLAAPGGKALDPGLGSLWMRTSCFPIGTSKGVWASAGPTRNPTSITCCQASTRPF